MISFVVTNGARPPYLAHIRLFNVDLGVST